jgi:5-formyltetrahydrofolate cyclo-ligase
MTISESKKNLRFKIRSLLKEKYSDEKIRLQFSEKAVKKIEDAPFFKESEIVLSFIPLGTETEVFPLIFSAWKSGKKVCVPRVLSGTFQMDFYFLEETVPLESQLEKGAFGILEPGKDLKKLELNKSLKDKKILMIVPGLAFDRKGRRLGKGKGFYDRYIPQIKKTECSLFTAGICFEEQLQEEVPFEETDFVLDSVVTPSDIFTAR